MFSWPLYCFWDQSLELCEISLCDCAAGPDHQISTISLTAVVHVISHCVYSLILTDFFQHATLVGSAGSLVWPAAWCFTPNFEVSYVSTQIKVLRGCTTGSYPPVSFFFLSHSFGIDLFLLVLTVL